MSRRLQLAIEKCAGQWRPLTEPGEGWVRADLAEELSRAGFRTAHDFFEAKGELLSKPGLGNRSRARLVFPFGTFYLKRFGPESFAARVKRWMHEGVWDESPGEKECWAGLELERSNIPVASPVAVGRSRAEGSEPERSFVLLAAAPGEPAQQWRRNHRDEFRRQAEAATALGALARRFHQAGWRHRDFYLCHLFLEERLGRAQVTLIDLQRVFKPRRFPLRWRVKDLAQLNFSAEEERCSTGLRLRFWKEYWGEGWEALEARVLWGLVAAKTKAIRKREARRGAKRS